MELLIRSLLPPYQYSYRQESGRLLRKFKTNTDYFKYSFFPYCVEEWNKLGRELKNSTSISKFKKGLLAFIRQKMSSIYNNHDHVGIKFLIQ